MGKATFFYRVAQPNTLCTSESCFFGEVRATFRL